MRTWTAGEKSSPAGRAYIRCSSDPLRPNDSLDDNVLDEGPGLEHLHYVQRLAGDLPPVGTSNIFLKTSTCSGDGCSEINVNLGLEVGISIIDVVLLLHFAYAAKIYNTCVAAG
jgi:hypothetical protein